MNLAARITALLTSLSPAQIRAMAPADRQRLAGECLRVLQVAMPPPTPPQGVLADLKDGRQG